MALTPKPEVIPEIVIEAIKKAFEKSYKEIIPALKWDSICGCYLFQKYGMTIGVELDGYIHS